MDKRPHIGYSDPIGVKGSSSKKRKKKMEMTTFKLSKVAELITEAGFPAYVEMTGGNCGTILVGQPDAEGFYTTAGGAGSFADDEGWYEEFHIGRDNDEAEGFYFHDYNHPNTWSEQSVANAMIHAHKIYLQKVGA
jgi:hypothetical protein